MPEQEQGTAPAHAPPQCGRYRRHARRMVELEVDLLAMLAGRKAPALDHGHLVRHVGMRGIVGNHIDAGLRHDLARSVFSMVNRHVGSTVDNN